MEFLVLTGFRKVFGKLKPSACHLVGLDQAGALFVRRHACAFASCQCRAGHTGYHQHHQRPIPPCADHVIAMHGRMLVAGLDMEYVGVFAFDILLFGRCCRRCALSDLDVIDRS